MLVRLVHLSGPRRGDAEVLRGPSIVLGAEPRSDVALESAADLLPAHARIELDGGGALLRAEGPVACNRRPVEEILLEDGDLLELGEEVRLRVQLIPEEEDERRSYHAMLASAAGPRRRSSWPLADLRGRAVFLAALLFLTVVLGGAYLVARANAPDLERVREVELTQARRATAQRRSYERRIAALKAQLQNLRSEMTSRDELQAQVVKVQGQVQRAMASVEDRVLEKLSGEIERTLDSNPEIAAMRDAARKMDEHRDPAERVIAKNAPSVCLIHGSYGFAREEDGEWRFLREVSREILEKLDHEGDKVPLTLEGEGPLFRIDYTGTGFLVDAERGLVLTNRHIAEPWWRNEAAQPLLDDGFRPRFLELRAFFPGRREPIVFRRQATLASDDADLAVLAFEPAGELPPALPLAPPDSLAPGRRILLLGYPSGLKALVAKWGEEFADAFLDGEAFDASPLLEALSREGMIRPLPSHGYVGDLLRDKVLYDAPTAVGGSGGPVLDLEGRVVAVNYGILKAFRGANFGVPISFAHPLLENARLSDDARKSGER